MLKTITATRYVTPLREGGSVPAVVETDDNGALYAMKFIGAGQGAKALIAELIAGALAQTLQLPIPELALITFDPVIGRSEPHPEIQDILQSSGGLNIGLQFISNALPFDPALPNPIEAELASRIVWFDAYITNVDRTARNVNLLVRHNKIWLIDHGAAFYFHHAWHNYLSRSESAFPLIKEHVLLPFASQLDKVDAELRSLITMPLLETIINQIPDSWLDTSSPFVTPNEHRSAYLTYLMNRLSTADNFVQEAQRAHANLI